MINRKISASFSVKQNNYQLAMNKAKLEDIKLSNVIDQFLETWGDQQNDIPHEIQVKNALQEIKKKEKETAEAKTKLELLTSKEKLEELKKQENQEKQDDEDFKKRVNMVEGMIKSGVLYDD